MPIIKVVSVPIKVSGAKDAELAIGRVNAAAEKLSTSDPTVKIKVDAARAILEARIARAGIMAELQRAGAGNGRGGILGSLFGGLFGGGASGAAGAAGPLAGILGGTGPIGAAVAAAAALTAALAGAGGVVPAIAAAGIGLAAFGALAIPTFSKISAAVAGTKGAMAALDPAEKLVVKGIQGIQAEFGRLSKALSPLVTQILGVGVQIAQKLLPAMLPFAEAAGKAILGLVKQFDRFASSPGFKSFMNSMLSLAGPAITTIGRGIGDIAANIGKMLQRMVTPQGIMTLHFILKGIAGLIDGIGLAFEGLPKVLFTVGPTVLRTVGQWALGIRNFGDQVLTTLENIVGPMAAVARALHLPFASTLTDIERGLFTVHRTFDSTITGMQRSLNNLAIDLIRAPKVFKLQGDITDLQAKIAAGLALLKNKNLTATRKARIEANIDQLQVGVAAAKAALASIQNRTVFVTSVINSVPGPVRGHASGGWASGWTLAGEQGPELMYTPGSQVYTAPQTAAMLSGHSGGSHYTININTLVASRDTGRHVVEAIKQFEQGSGASWRKP